MLAAMFKKPGRATASVNVLVKFVATKDSERDAGASATAAEQGACESMMG